MPILAGLIITATGPTEFEARVALQRQLGNQQSGPVYCQPQYRLRDDRQRYEIWQYICQTELLQEN